MSQSCHAMPFGCQLLPDGELRFRFWAPAANKVELFLTGEGEPMLTMVAQEEGWFELVTDQAAPGSHYCFRIDGGICVPDPASRYQPEGVHGASRVIDPHSWSWQDKAWRGRPWHEAVFYELHIGSFTPQGTYTAAAEKLDYLVELGVTAIEIMPLAESPGEHNWGYDGVQLFAPEQRYGTPDELKALIETAHAKGMMVFLDVVYNHFGPEGNYLHLYAPHFFTEHHHTPWGKAINFDDEYNHWVREFFIHNACYWLEEYHFDGLRLDAVHAIDDDSTPHILVELARRARHCCGERQIHLVLENDDNAAHYLIRDERNVPLFYVAQWNDDTHHAMHVLLTGEDHGYYGDYAEAAIHHLGRCLSQGFAYQGEVSVYRQGRQRGEPSGHLPPTAFVSFLQNHDMVGNRAFGERITRLADEHAVRAALAVLLLAPSPPLLFMGQEWGSRQPFPFFCDFGEELAGQVSEGRRREFAAFPGFDEAKIDQIPDPQQADTFYQAVLDWSELDQPAAQKMYTLHRRLLALRNSEIVPLLADVGGESGHFTVYGDRVLEVIWQLVGNTRLTMVANLSNAEGQPLSRPAGEVLFATDAVAIGQKEIVPGPWSVVWFLNREPYHDAG